MAHFIGITIEMYDGKEWSHKSLIEAKSQEEAEKKLRENALAEFSDSDSIVHKTYIQQEIPAEHAVILAKYL